MEKKHILMYTFWAFCLLTYFAWAYTQHNRYEYIEKDKVFDKSTGYTWTHYTYSLPYKWSNNK